MTIETKYNIGDEVWFMYRNKIFCGRICCVVAWCNNLSYKVSFESGLYTFLEELIFPTKEELLKSL